MGTPDYISPEQARGDPDVDIRSDLYGLGATLYHMLTGRPPFEGNSPALVMSKHLTESPKPPRQLDPTISQLGEVIVLRLLQKRREDRYQTPAECLQKVDEALRLLQAARGVHTGPAARPIAAPEPAPSRPPPSVPRRRRSF
jgi:serine/threonine-protein kinase